MRITLHLITSLALAAGLAAHGGQYRGPGDNMPPGGKDKKSGGGAAARASSGGGSAGPASSGGASTGTSGGPVAAPTAGSRGASSMPRGVSLGPDPSQWQSWWEFHKDPYLSLRQRLRTSRDELARDRRGLRRLGLPPSRKDLVEGAIPALRTALSDQKASRDLVSACLIALAKIGDKGLRKQCIERLASADQEIRETAALALGIGGDPSARGELEALVLDNERGRKLTGRPRVDYRTRAFAIYGLGLLAQANPENLALARTCVESVAPLLEQRSRLDLQIAATQALRLLPESKATGAATLRESALDLLTACIDDSKRSPLVRAQALNAAASVARDPGPRRDLVRRSAKILENRKSSHWMQQSAALALASFDPGALADARKALRRFALNGRDRQARRFAILALGRGKHADLEFLRERLSSSKTIATQLPWYALSLAHACRKRHEDLRVEVGREVHEIFRKAKTPMVAAGLSIALGLLGHEDAGEDVHDRLVRSRHDDEPVGYLALSLGLMGYQPARPTVRALLTASKRRPLVLVQSATALGLLGDPELGPLLTEQLQHRQSVAVYGAVARAIGLIDDRRALDPLETLLGDARAQPLTRAFAAVALGLLGDKDELPWSSRLAFGINYRAGVGTLTGDAGILSIF